MSNDELTPDLEARILRFSHNLLRVTRMIGGLEGLDVVSIMTGVGHTMAHMMAAHTKPEYWPAVTQQLIADAADIKRQADEEDATPPELRECAGSA